MEWTFSSVIMDPPDGVQMISRYQNLGMCQNDEQEWKAKFDQLSGVISESNKELGKELSKELKNAMLPFMDIVGKAVVNNKKKGKSVSCICYCWI